MKCIATLCLFLPLVACSGDAEPTNAATPTTTSTPTLDHIERSVHDVECGCTIEGIGACGNYVLLEGTPVPIRRTEAGADLGVMEWCGMSDVKAEIEGDVEDGEFVASYVRTIEA